jgi:hypothetical protein
VFQAPKNTTYVAPADPIDVNQRYLVRVVDLVDQGVSKYADPADTNPAHRIRWVFRMGQLDGTPILDMDGQAYEHFDYTSNKTSKGKTHPAQARLWMEAFLGPLEDEDITANIHERLKDKVAVALFEEVTRGDDEGVEQTARIRILRLSPYTKTKPVPKPVPQPDPSEAVAF